MAPQPSRPTGQPPPDVPPDTGLNTSTTTYLRSFALWCLNALGGKLNANAALPGVMLQAYDVTGNNPPVYMLEVDAAGSAMLAPVALGSGDLGTPVPIGTGEFLAVDDAGFVPNNIGILADPTNNYGYVGFFDNTGERRGYVGFIHDAPTSHVRMSNDTGGANLDVDDDGWIRCSGPADFNQGITTRYGQTILASNTGYIGNPTGGYTGVNVVSGGSNDAFITFLSPSAYGLNVGLNANGYFYRGGWSDGNVYHWFWTQREWGGPACDHRMKEKIEPLASTWDHIKALKTIKYRQRKFTPAKGGRALCEADDRERWGFLAHELQETLGETAAHCEKDHPDVLQAVNMNMVVAALTRTVQELQTRVEALEGAR